MAVTVDENERFLSVRLLKHMDIDINKVIHMGMSGHAGCERRDRFKRALEQNRVCRKQAPFHAVFEVNKDHADGIELHCVTMRGIIIIMNQYKYHMEDRPIITVFLARRNQVVRLYDAAGLAVPGEILSCCDYYAANNMNR